MFTTVEINNALEVINTQIDEKTAELEPLRSAHKNAKALYENNYSRYYLETKAKNTDWADGRVKALATNLAYNDKLDAIKAESSYMKVNNELKALYTEVDCLKEQSYNIRAELNRLK